jgi:hypothetical protein
MGPVDNAYSSLIGLLVKDLEALAAENAELLRSSSLTREALASRTAQL